MRNILKRYYQKFNKNYQANYLNKREFKYFQSCRKILDVGCGIGEFVLQDKKRIIGLDHNKDSLKLCKKKNLNVVYGEVTKLPFKDNSFDGVHCAHVIEHLFPKEAYLMLAETGRVLKKNGIFVISTPLLWSGFYHDFTHIKPYTPESLIRYLCIEGEQKNFDNIKAKFKKEDLYWRYRPLPLPGRLGKLFANFLYQHSIHTLQKDAYTLVLKKII